MMETLFSLEVVVESVQIRGVQCRLPAVAFRLLDFPTLLIRHDVTEAALRMRELGINSDPTWAPIEEEHGQAGRFKFGKGKSCLLRMQPEVLRDHLKNIPLYVMVIDSWADVPRLVGSSSVPLTVAMEMVYQDIQSEGTTAPSVHGEKGEFPLHNLMGTKIGTVEMGYRLMSLGTMLMQHVPREAVMQRQGAERHEERQAPIKESGLETPISKPSEGDVLVARATQYEYNRADSPPTVATQTEVPIKARKVNGKEEPELVSDNNIICPPPLYYNSTAADPPHKTPKPRSAPPTGRMSYNISDFYSEIGESPEEENQDPQIRVAKVERGVQTSQTVKVQTVHENNQDPPVGLPNGIPLLRQLFSELSLLEGRSAATLVSDHPAPREGAKVTISRPETAPTRPLHPRPGERDQAKEGPGVIRGTPLRVRHEPCARSDRPVPRTRSWIRQVPPAPRGRGRSRLKFGMTHSLRLRIQQSNPAWLEKMETERASQQYEVERPQRPPHMPIEQLQHPRKQRPSEQTISVHERHMKKKDGEYPGLITETSLIFDEADVHAETKTTDEKHETRRKPVPTPRQRSHSETDIPDEEEPLPFDRSLVELETPKFNVDVGLVTAGSSESENQSKKSIQVFLPIVPNQDDSELPDGEIDQQELEEKQTDKSEQKEDLARQDAVSEPESGPGYSEDFESHDEYSTAASHVSLEDTSRSVRSSSPASQVSTTVDRRQEAISKPKRDLLEDRRSPDSVASGRSDRSRQSAFSQASSRPRAGSFGLGAPPPPTPSKSPVMGTRQSIKKAIPADHRTSNNEDSQEKVDRNVTRHPPPRVAPRDRKISTNTTSVSSYVPSHLSSDMDNLSTDGSLNF